MVSDLALQRLQLLGIFPRARQQRGGLFGERVGLEDLPAAILEKLAGILQRRFQLVLHYRPLRRLEPAWVLAFDGAFDPVGNAEARRQPNDLLAPPGGPVGTRMVPVFRLLRADDLETIGAADRLHAAHPPATVGPAFFGRFPALLGADAILGSFEKRAALDGRRRVERQNKRLARRGRDAALAVHAGDFEADGTGDRFLDALGFMVVVETKNGKERQIGAVRLRVEDKNAGFHAVAAVELNRAADRFLGVGASVNQLLGLAQVRGQQPIAAVRLLSIGQDAGKQAQSRNHGTLTCVDERTASKSPRRARIAADYNRRRHSHNAYLRHGKVGFARFATAG